jgi:hypothetical protein
MLNNIREQKNIAFILMGGLFFIVFKFSIIDLLWSGRVSPPMPADSILYITGLKDYIQTGDTSTTLYLSFVLLFGNLAKLLTISALDVYEIQFYLGALFSLFSICFLMQRLEFSGKSILTACILLAVMRVMPGSNFWIVPNYWSVYLCLFFIAFSFGRNQRLSLLFMISVPIIATFGAFFHRSFIFYSAGMFSVLLVLSVLFEGKGFNKRFLYSLVVTILSYMLVISSVDFLGAAKVTAYPISLKKCHLIRSLYKFLG